MDNEQDNKKHNTELESGIDNSDLVSNLILLYALQTQALLEIDKSLNGIIDAGILTEPIEDILKILTNEMIYSRLKSIYDQFPDKEQALDTFTEIVKVMSKRTNLQTLRMQISCTKDDYSNMKLIINDKDYLA